MLGVVAEVEKGVVVRAGDEDDIAAVAAVASGRTTSGHVFFAAEREAAVASVAGFDFDADFVDEHVKNEKAARASRRPVKG
jgi:hypothetical protein